MAWRLNKSVVKGEIDNRTRGRVTGRIWLLGRQEPLALELEGNGLNDLAGSLVRFVNPTPSAGDAVDLSVSQKGYVGDITASRRVRDLPRSNAAGRKPRARWRNCLYVEWYSETNGRVVIESTDYQIEISERMWTPLPEEDDAQRSSNQEMICSWLDELTERFSGSDDEAEEMDMPEDRPMNEFEWEQFMRESDARAEKFARLFEKYMDHPDRDRIIAREMGWSWLEDAIETEEDEEEEEDDAELFTPSEEWFDEVPELVPNPLTEGRDWIRNEHGHVEHPLTERAHRLGIDMWRYAEDTGCLREGGDENIRELVFKTQTTSAKLAGALNHLAYENDPDNGFIVAALKRTLSLLHEGLAAGSRIAPEAIAKDKRLDSYLRELFGIRQEILSLMQYYRQRIS